MPQVLLAESMCAFLLGFFRTKVYKELRLKALPVVKWLIGLNRSDPLGSVGLKRRRQRQHDISEAENSGQLSVWASGLFCEEFAIPGALGKEWNLDEEPTVNLQWVVAQDAHTHAFALAPGWKTMQGGMTFACSTLLARLMARHQLLNWVKKISIFDMVVIPPHPKPMLAKSAK